MKIWTCWPVVIEELEKLALLVRDHIFPYSFIVCMLLKNLIPNSLINQKAVGAAMIWTKPIFIVCSNCNDKWYIFLSLYQSKTSYLTIMIITGDNYMNSPKGNLTPHFGFFSGWVSQFVLSIYPTGLLNQDFQCFCCLYIIKSFTIKSYLCFILIFSSKGLKRLRQL